MPFTVPVLPEGVDPAWLPPEAFRPVGIRRTLVDGSGPLADTAHGELAHACARFGGEVVVRGGSDASYDLVLRAAHAGSAEDAGPASGGIGGLGAFGDFGGTGGTGGAEGTGGLGDLGDDGFVLERADGTTTVTAYGQTGLLYGLFHVVRLGEDAFRGTRGPETHRPATALRMLDHWDNVAVHPVMGQVERGYAGGSLFWRNGRARGEWERVRGYARLLAACGINAVALNNVNVHEAEAHLLTDRIGEVADIARELRPYGVQTHLSVTFAAPIVLGPLSTADPLDEAVRDWWAEAVRGCTRPSRTSAGSS